MRGDIKSKFLQVYEILKSQLLNDPAFEFTDASRQWLHRMLDYNVPKGKLIRAMCVIDCYQALKEGNELNEDEFFLACVLGWCIEWFQAWALIVDDIMDNSHLRRGQPCWFRLPEVGMIAINDALILRNQVTRILKMYFREKPYYVDMMDLFNEVEFQTFSGEMLDLITTRREKSIEIFNGTLSPHCRVQECLLFNIPSGVPCLDEDYFCHPSNFSFTLIHKAQAVCALLLAGQNVDEHSEMTSIFIEIGAVYQIQDDYLDCFGDPKITGKVGTDIEEGKCSWLVVKALERANKEQKQLLSENYGKADPDCVAKVKQLYEFLDLPGVYAEYKRTTIEKLKKSVESHPNKLVKAVWQRCTGAASN